MENKSITQRAASTLVWLILPVVCAWAWRQQAMILREGASLTAEGLADALRVGVLHPERVRTLVVERVPPRFPPLLRMLASGLGWGPETTAGMALGYGIFLRADQTQRGDLVLHELVHTAQYERLGFRAFLRAYLHECLTAGYPLGDLEREARRIACGNSKARIADAGPAGSVSDRISSSPPALKPLVSKAK